MKSGLILFFMISFSTAFAVEKDAIEQFFTEYSSSSTTSGQYDVLKRLIDFTAEADAEALLLVVSKPLHDVDSALLYFIKAEAFYYADQADYALKFYDEAIRVAVSRKPSDPILLSTLYGARAYVTEVTSGALPALEYYLQALTYAEESQYQREVADVNYSLAKTYSILSDFEHALIHAKRSFELDLALNDPAVIATDLRLLAEFSLQTKDILGAKRYADEALALAPRLDNKRLIASLYKKKAECLNQLNQTDSALLLIEQSIQLEQDYPDSDRLASAYKTYAQVYFNDHQYTKALPLILQAEQEAIQKKQARQQVEILALKAEILNALGRESAFEATAIQAIKSASTQSMPKVKVVMYKALAAFYEQQGLYQQALKFKTEETLLQDSISQQLSQSRIEITAAQFNMARISSEKDQLELNLELLDQKVKTNQRSKLLLACVLFFSLSLMAVYWYNRNRKAQLKERIFQQQLITNDRHRLEAELQAIRSQLNPHFMFNSLNSINDFILRQATEDASAYLVKFSKLMRLVLNHSKEQEVLFEKELESIQLYVELEALRFEGKLKVLWDIEAALVNGPQFWITPMLIQPFIENAIWHGLHHSKNEKCLEITFSSHEQTLLCKVEDNGIGRAASNQVNRQRQHVSKGQQLMRNRFELIEEFYDQKASFTIQDRQPQGTVVTIEIPILG